MKKRFVYADNAATTKISEQVLEAMLPWLKESYGNPSSIHVKGREALSAMDRARAQTAAAIGAKPGEIYFTSSGSEADNWALKGVARAARRRNAASEGHIITTAIEHHAVLNSAKALQREGFAVTYVRPDAEGMLAAADIAAALRDDTCLVSVMYANNEIGTIEPIAEIGALCRKRGVLFHTDAVQAAAHIKIDVEAQNIDLLSLSGHKIHAPKGVGALYIRKSVPKPESLIDGGTQEAGRRAGTENVAGIVGLGAAMKALSEKFSRETEPARENSGENFTFLDNMLISRTNRLIDGLLEIPGTKLNGHRAKRLPGNANITFDGLEAESLLLLLDAAGIAASAGSACSSGSLDASHVLLAIGRTQAEAMGAVRFSLGADTSDEDVDYILETTHEAVRRLHH